MKDEEFSSGDKVRILDQTGAGTVIGMEGMFVLVETEDGFPVKYHPSQIVLVSKPATIGKSTPQAPRAAAAPHSPRGLYCLIDPPGLDGLSTLYLANCLPYALYFVLAEQHGQHWQSPAHGHLQPGSYERLAVRRFSEANHWTTTELRILPCGNPVLVAYTAYPLKISPKKLMDSLAEAPLKGGQAYVHRLDGQGAAQAFVYHEPTTQAPVGQVPIPAGEFAIRTQPVPDVVDLHLEKLPKGEKMGNKDMALTHQLSHACQMIERAVAQDKKEITFIHGVGQGVLKTALERLCREHPHVCHCGPASPALYGNGAMLVLFQ